MYGINADFESFPSDEVSFDPVAYRIPLSKLRPGSLVVIFTPDDTHFSIASECIEAGVHVLIAKPAVKTLAEHNDLSERAKRNGVLCCVEMHKRFDPIYSDAKVKLANLGDLSFFSSYMSQPKIQLETFAKWAGVGSDISYYLNSHHVDFCSTIAKAKHFRPVSVTASGSVGVATGMGLPPSTEDTITLLVTWKKFCTGEDLVNHGNVTAHSVHTASWIAPKSDVHSQQRFHCMCVLGEATVDQAHRGYTTSDDLQGKLVSPNPLFMRYTPGEDGSFAGQYTYGYRSFELFMNACRDLNAKVKKLEHFDQYLATLESTAVTTAILEAGRKSLDLGGKPISILYNNNNGDKTCWFSPTNLE